jgi:hypothetical protein
MSYQILMRHFKTPGRLAALMRQEGCGISTQAIYKWREKGIPPERVLLLEKLSCGAITRYQLLPDVFGSEPAEKVA